MRNVQSTRGKADLIIKGITNPGTKLPDEAFDKDYFCYKTFENHDLKLDVSNLELKKLRLLNYSLKQLS